MNPLEEWLKTFLETYRERYSSLSPELKTRIPRFNDFSPVCQLELIQFDDPLRQILLISRFEDEKDLEIEIHDPVPNDYMVNKLDEITKNPKWGKLLEPQFLIRISQENHEQRHYKYYLERHFIDLYQNRIPKKDSKITSPTIIIRHSAHLTDTEPNKFSYWVIHGSISDYDLNHLVDSIFKDLNDQQQEESENLEVNERAKGFFSFIYPPIWLDEFPDFKEQALESTEQYKKLVLTLKYRESQLLFYKDGGIGIIEKNKSDAIKKLNEIMGTLVFHNIPAYSIGEYDLTPSVWRLPDFFQESTTAPAYSIRLFQWDDRNNHTKVMFPYYWRKKIKSSELEKVINSASEVTDKIGIDLMSLYIEAYTDLREKQYIQSFVLSWVIIERLINEFWKNYLEDKGLSKNRVTKVTESSDWTASIKVETKNLLGLINDEEYTELSVLRKTRNNFIHNEGEISENDAKKCYNWSKELINRKLQRKTENLV